MSRLYAAIRASGSWGGGVVEEESDMIGVSTEVYPS
jgi:hypothetical protein